MKTDLNRQQIMIIVENARYRRSVAAGQVTTDLLRKIVKSLARGVDRFLHLLLMSPVAPR